MYLGWVETRLLDGDGAKQLTDDQFYSAISMEQLNDVTYPGRVTAHLFKHPNVPTLIPNYYQNEVESSHVKVSSIGPTLYTGSMITLEWSGFTASLSGIYIIVGDENYDSYLDDDPYPDSYIYDSFTPAPLSGSYQLTITRSAELADQWIYFVFENWWHSSTGVISGNVQFKLNYTMYDVSTASDTCQIPCSFPISRDNSAIVFTTSPDMAQYTTYHVGMYAQKNAGVWWSIAVVPNVGLWLIAVLLVLAFIGCGYLSLKDPNYVPTHCLSLRCIFGCCTRSSTTTTNRDIMPIIGIPAYAHQQQGSFGGPTPNPKHPNWNYYPQ